MLSFDSHATFNENKTIKIQRQNQILCLLWPLFDFPIQENLNGSNFQDIASNKKFVKVYI